MDWTLILLSWLYRDKLGKDRNPDSLGFVTFGAIEYESSQIPYNDTIYNIKIVPNPSDGNFSVMFNNPEDEYVSINLIDYAGRIINLCHSFVSAGEQVYRFNENLSSGTYLILMRIGNNEAAKQLKINKQIIK